MLVVEIHHSRVPVIYRADKIYNLIRRKDRTKVYKFACKAQLLQRLKVYDYEHELEILAALDIEPEPPFVYPVHVERMRQMVRKVLLPRQTAKEIESEETCPVPSTEFNYSATSEPSQKSKLPMEE